MAKFPSIWGDLNVGSVIPKEESKEEPKKATPPTDDDDTIESAAGDEEEEEIVATVDKKGEEDEEVDGKPKEKEEEKEEKIEYDEAEIERAYNLLIDQGVLPEPKEGDEFDITPTGLADSVSASVRQMLADEIAAIPPSVQQYYAHVMEGKDPGSFKVDMPIDWDDMNLEEDENKEAALLQFYVNQGMSQEDAQEEVDDVRTAGKLDKKAEVARESLVKIQNANKTDKAARDAKAESDAAKKADDEIEALKATIDSAKAIAGFELDPKRKEAFKEYLFKINKRTGKTQMQENMSNEDRRLNIAFLDFVNYNKEDLKKEVTTDLTKSRKKILTRYSDKGVKGSNSSKSITTKTDTKKGKLAFPTIFGSQSIEVED